MKEKTCLQVRRQEERKRTDTILEVINKSESIMKFMLFFEAGLEEGTQYNQGHKCELVLASILFLAFLH